MRQAVHLAEEVGTMLGGGALLFGEMPSSSRCGDVTGEMPVSLPITRQEAIARLEDFMPFAPAYAARRNFVPPGHENVSRLSPSTRTRVILEREILAAAREQHDPAMSEKFEQEVWWRLYWKGWLEQRPSIWKGYREALRPLQWTERAQAVMAGESGVAIIDHFTRELIATGYLHNHARMWWASYWIHAEGLPWQLGAHFFLQHLRDGDAASNTLSWRWVAGLHTRGKAYLVRRSNLESYVDPDLLGKHAVGLDQLGSVKIRSIPWEEPPVPRKIAASEPLPGSRTGIWIHDEDLSVERSPLAWVKPTALIATSSIGIWEREAYSPKKCSFLRLALADGAGRTSAHFGLPCELVDYSELAASLATWATGEKLDTLMALHPFTGPLADELPAIERVLASCGIVLNLVRRPEDVSVMNFATGGFFGFWEKVRGK